MVQHLEVSKCETFVFYVEHVCLDRAKIERRYPGSGRRDNPVDKATLNVADKDQQEYYIEALEAIFDIFMLVQIRNH